VLAGEVALLLHELSHAALARLHGLRVRRIVFHGFRAHTVLDAGQPLPGQEALIALAGPAMNVALAGAAELVRLTITSQGALDAFLLTLVVGNAAAAGLSLLPVGGSDGARALAGLRRRAMLQAEVTGQPQDEHDEDQQA
jgi:Zn-dependent protease